MSLRSVIGSSGSSTPSLARTAPILPQVVPRSSLTGADAAGTLSAGLGGVGTLAKLVGAGGFGQGATVASNLIGLPAFLMSRASTPAKAVGTASGGMSLAANALPFLAPNAAKALGIGAFPVGGDIFSLAKAVSGGVPAAPGAVTGLANVGGLLPVAGIGAEGLLLGLGNKEAMDPTQTVASMVLPGVGGPLAALLGAGSHRSVGAKRKSDAEDAGRVATVMSGLETTSQAKDFHGFFDILTRTPSLTVRDANGTAYMSMPPGVPWGDTADYHYSPSGFIKALLSNPQSLQVAQVEHPGGPEEAAVINAAKAKGVTKVLEAAMRLASQPDAAEQLTAMDQAAADQMKALRATWASWSPEHLAEVAGVAQADQPPTPPPSMGD